MATPTVKLKKRTQEDAARMLAECNHTITEIAAKIGVSERTIYAWSKRPDFALRRQQLASMHTERAMSLGLANRANRTLEHQEAYHLKKRLRQARGADPRMAQIPGGDTGLLVVTDYRKVKARQPKLGANGQPLVVNGQPVLEDIERSVPIVAFDAGLDREMRADLEQIAQETGQRVQKHEVRFKRPEEMSDEEVTAWLTWLQAGGEIPEGMLPALTAAPVANTDQAAPGPVTIDAQLPQQAGAD